MKPRLKVAECTEEDTRILLRHFYAPETLARFGAKLTISGVLSDRRDADLMFWLSRFTARHYCGALTRQTMEQGWCPVVQKFMWMDPGWPIGHHVLEV